MSLAFCISKIFPTRNLIAGCWLLPLLLMTAGCSSRADDDARDARALNMQVPTPPFSLDPALASGGRTAVFNTLAYDSLTYLTGEGRLIPNLATSWRYASDDKRVFEMTLRAGVHFSDGTPMTADSVAKSIRYFIGAGGPMLRTVGNIVEVKAVDDRTVRLAWAEPNPDPAMTMSQYYGIGLVISPSGVANPGTLLTNSAGTGQFIYDQTASIPNSSYVYRLNPHYWNRAAQQYDRVTVKVISDPNSVVAAMQSGQLDFANGAVQTAAVAKEAGIRIVAAPYYTWSLVLADRNGAVCPPLADLRVRQAIAYALDRKLLARALGHGYAMPSGQPLLKGADGYVDGLEYPFDLRRAKQLMAQAGYPEGFTLPVLAQSLTDPNSLIAQAVAGSLADIGIKVRLHIESTGLAQFTQAMASKKFPAFIFPTTGADMAQWAHIALPPRGGFNPFGSVDSTVNDLLNRAYVTESAERTALYRQASRRLNALAWVVPLFGTQNIFYVNNRLENVTISLRNPSPMPTGPGPAFAWRPAK